MTYTDKAWLKASRLQKINEGMQTDKIEMLDKVCFTEIDKKVYKKTQGTYADKDITIWDGAHVGEDERKQQDGGVVRDEQEGTIEQHKAENSEMVSSKKAPPKDKVAELFAQTHLAALKASKQQKRKNPFLKEQAPHDEAVSEQMLVDVWLFAVLFVLLALGTLCVCSLNILQFYRS